MRLTAVHVENRLPQAPWLRALVRMLGLALVTDPASAQVVVGSAAGAGLGKEGALRLQPGPRFGHNGRVGTYDAAAVAALGAYRRERRGARFGGQSFSAPVDGHGHTLTVAAFARTLLSLLMENGHEVAFLWWYPRAARGVANFRIDVDDNEDHSLARMVARLEPHLPWCSFYITTAPFAGEAEPLHRAAQAGAEIGCHFHHHYTFERDPLTNRRNAARSLAWLRRQGFPVTGLVTPSAKSFPGIAGLLTEEELAYTSNFGVIHDALPLEWENGDNRYLEIPIHPVAPGNLRKGLPEDMTGPAVETYLAAYYHHAAQALEQAHLPVFLYAHTNDCLDVSLLPDMLGRLREALPHHAFLRLEDYAAFWRHRLDRLAEAGKGLDPVDNVARLNPLWPREVRITGADGMEQRWPFALDGLFRAPTAFTGAVERLKLSDRLRDRFEFEDVLPMAALALGGREGWVSLGYKLASRCFRCLRP